MTFMSKQEVIAAAHFQYASQYAVYIKAPVERLRAHLHW